MAILKNQETNSPEGLRSYVLKNMEQLFFNLDFKPNTRNKAGNFDAEIATFTTAVGANVIRHKLEREPVGYIVIDKDKLVNLYTNSKSETTLSLQADVAGAVVKLLII